MKRAIQKYLEDALAEEIINAHLNEGDKIKVILDKKKWNSNENLPKKFLQRNNLIKNPSFGGFYFLLGEVLLDSSSLLFHLFLY